MLNEPFSQQPFLHDRTICIHAPSMWVSGSDGQMREGVDGVYVADQRIVQEFVVRIDDREPDEMAVSLDGASAACFLSDARTVTDHLTPDPKSRVTRSRRATAAGGTEDIVITNRNRHAMTFTLTIMLLGDATPIATIKNGISHEPQLEYIQLLDGQRWSNEHRSTEVHFQPAPVEWTGSQARWQCEVTPGDSFLLSLQLTTTQTSSALAEVAVRPPWSVTSLPLATTTGDALRSLLARSMHDVSALLMSDRARPDDVFVAAGAPWYLTLFGRDSLWAARLMLPVTPDLALTTARILARRQGLVRNTATQETPGSILHELRDAEAGVGLPPVYYGTIDATPLFVSVIAEALNPSTTNAVHELLPAVEAALGWIAASAEVGEGFLRYESHEGGLRNHGWKDSGDSVQWMNGELASGPVALCEVQGYAYQAALQGADLLDHFDRPGGDSWRRWAQALRDRFRASFWVDGYVAIALDHDHQPVDAVASNMGHLLGTGLLDAAEETRVVDRLLQRDMFSGWGVRTLSTDASGFNPAGYHNGSVWVHDTAIIARGMFQAGYVAEATTLAQALLDTAPHFEFRLPELFCGDDRAVTPLPVPYPASCRPQAWAAASAIVVAKVLGAI